MRRVALAVVVVSAGVVAGCSAVGGQNANYDHQLSVYNGANETRTGTLEVVANETGATVFEQTVTLAPNTSRTVLDFESVRDSGSTAFWVYLHTSSGETSKAYVRMSNHIGNVRATFYPDTVRILVEG